MKSNSEPRRHLALMYHAIDKDVREPTWRWSLSLARFASHIGLLSRLQRRCVRVSELLPSSSSGDPRIAITFDDGYQDNWPAFEALQQSQLPATWFVVTGFLGLTDSWAGATGNRSMLSKSQIRQLAAAGMEIGSHTVNHSRLSVLSPQAQLRELSDSRKQLEDCIGAPVLSVAYPYGDFGERTLQVAQEAGYAFGVTCRSGWIQPDCDPLAIPRIAVENRDASWRLSHKLRFGSNESGLLFCTRYYAGRIFARARALFINDSEKTT